MSMLRLLLNMRLRAERKKGSDDFYYSEVKELGGQLGVK